ncbi:MAG: PAS domain-containing protein [Methylococcaceae bacterium]
MLLFFLDSKLTIKRFTRQAIIIIKLIDSDAGRPIEDLISNLKYGDCALLRNHLTETLTSNIALESYFLDIKFPVIGEKRLMINGRILEQSPGTSILNLLSIEDVTEKASL